MKKRVSSIPIDPARMATATAVLRANREELFHPVEHAILRKFFRMRPRRSDPQDLLQFDGLEGDDAIPRCIGIDHRLESRGLENAVARICLGAIQQRLPNYGTMRHGKFVLGRNRYARSVRTIEPKPVFLFEINWADSAPGISWPVSYHATWVPGYERWVVTASADGKDVWGCTDIALGSFGGRDIRVGAGRVIRKEWRDAYRGWEQQPWAYLMLDGTIAKDEALAWRQRVWRGHEDL